MNLLQDLRLRRKVDEYKRGIPEAYSSLNASSNKLSLLQYFLLIVNLVRDLRLFVGLKDK